MIVTDQRVAEFIAARLGIEPCPPYTVMGIERDGTISAGLLFNCYEGRNIHVSAAGSGWTRSFLQAVGRYVFEQLNCTRMTFTTEQEHVAKLGERLGGAREGLLRDYFGLGRPGIIVGVLHQDYKYGSFPANS